MITQPGWFRKGGWRRTRNIVLALRGALVVELLSGENVERWRRAEAELLLLGPDRPGGRLVSLSRAIAGDESSSVALMVSSCYSPTFSHLCA